MIGLIIALVIETALIAYIGYMHARRAWQRYNSKIYNQGYAAGQLAEQQQLAARRKHYANIVEQA